MTAEEQNDRGTEPGPEPVTGQVPGQGGAPSRESLAGSPYGGAPVSGRVPGQAGAGQGGVTPEAFIARRGGPAGPGGDSAEDSESEVPLGLVPPPADPVDGELPPSDAELTALVRAGDDSAYEEIYRRHAEAVRRYARSCCRDSFTAEDLAGEVFARTFQALKAGKGPEFAVRAYLLTAVRNIAAAWTRGERREQLVDDFGSFSHSGAAQAIEYDLADPGADAWAMALADQRMVMQAFTELPEDDRLLLWHTVVEQESPKTVAVLLGKTANATAVQAHRARSRLAAGFLQAHVSGSQAQGCEEYANRLGLYARGALRKRASAEVGDHLRGCERCTGALLELVELNHALRLLLPGGVLVWIGAGAFSAIAAALGAGAVAGGAAAGGAVAGGAVAGGAVAGGAAAASAGTAAAGGTAGAAAGSTAGAAAGAGAAGAGAGAGGASGGGGASALAGEGLGTVAKAGIAAAVAVAAVAAVAYALAGSPAPAPPAAAPPPSAAPARPTPPPPVLPQPAPTPKAQPPTPVAPTPPPTHAPAPKPTPPKPRPTPSPKPSPTPSPTPSPLPVPTPPLVPTPPPAPTPVVPTPVVPTPAPVPSVLPSPVPSPVPVPPVQPPASYWMDELPFSTGGDRMPPPGPSISRRDSSGWLLQREGLRLGGASYQRGVSVHGPSTLAIDLNRSCASYDAVAGLDDATFAPGAVRFTVTGDDQRPLWSSPALRRGDAAVPIHVPLGGQHRIQLVVTPVDGLWSGGNIADWADARFTC
ncbi:sigma-70 family RNA polymerase sigma factor [Kitasatospora sp. NBC_01287]|uniref:sigma-70 family RNA polymerase sigma factor n=1 Tax=Kitasatospora sp. NBC_01287 TaxID=2903573 RepID=UPI002258E518|nr:sigma-70 family RNA polymerase sigma factor [Kitasatospora sp. NBC_01287]MCX4747427.1 sigma-70 family RNA polymerase sigma factor [Kitasatospora sp. NBC_01287]